MSALSPATTPTKTPVKADGTFVASADKDEPGSKGDTGNDQ